MTSELLGAVLVSSLRGRRSSPLSMDGFPGARHKRFRRQFRRMAMTWLEHQEMFAEGRLLWHPGNHSRSSDFVVPDAGLLFVFRNSAPSCSVSQHTATKAQGAADT
jgi:hypothetical protein